MTAQLNAPCPKCGGATISKGNAQRMCKPCNYRFRWPAVMCITCGRPQATGQGKRLPYCEDHYPTAQERRREAYRLPGAGKPSVKQVQPVARTPSGKAIRVGEDTIEITANKMLIINGGEPLPASWVEVALWEYIHRV